MPSIAAAAAMTADVISTSADAFDGPQLQSRNLYYLTDVTLSGATAEPDLLRRKRATVLTVKGRSDGWRE
jgi:hypothetical protein